jgi:hypothetical protein
MTGKFSVQKSEAALLCAWVSMNRSIGRRYSDRGFRFNRCLRCDFLRLAAESFLWLRADCCDLEPPLANSAVHGVGPCN